jgi:hypothetical protein
MSRSAALLAVILLAACDDGGGGGHHQASDVPHPDGGIVAADAADLPPAIDLTVTEPTEGALLKARRVHVAGQVTGDPHAMVQVNGHAATVHDGAFEAFVDLEPGMQTIAVTAGSERVEVHVTIDPSPPTLRIDAPARGTWQADASLMLRFHAEDESGLASLTLGDDPVDTGLGPDFALPVTLTPGLNVLRLTATDAAGNVARESVSVLNGDLRAPDGGIPNALRLQVGPDGLAAIARTARDFLDRQDLATLLPMQGFDFAGDHFALSIGQIGYDKPSTLELTPDAGKLRIHLRLDHVTVSLNLQIGMHNPTVLAVGAEYAEVSGFLTPSIDDQGHLQTALSDLDVQFHGFALGAGDVPQFQDDPSTAQDLVEEALSGGLSAFAEQRLPGILNDFLSKLADPIDLTLLGAAIRINLRPNVIVVGAAGLSARVDASVDLVDPPMAPADLAGYVGHPTDWDGVPDTTQIGLAVDDDLLNLLVFQLWRSGKLFPVIDQALIQSNGSQLGLVTGFLGQLLRKARPQVPANTPFRVATHLPLPPVAQIVEAEGGAGLLVGIGDLGVHIETDDMAAMDLLDGAISLQAPGTLGVMAVDGMPPKITLTVGQVVGSFDVTNDDLDAETAASVEQPVNDLFGALGGIIGGLFSGFPLPTFEGISVGHIALSVAGPDHDFLQATADLAQ